jgi:hypothetical protein
MTTVVRKFGIVAALVCGLALLPSVAGAGNGTSVPLGAGGFSAVVVDDAHQHVFISAGSADAVLVFDFQGNAVARIPNIYGAAGMVVNGQTLYVAERNAGTIGRIDLNTLADLGSLGSGLVTPNWLAFAGGKLWVTVGGSQWGQLASVTPTGTTTVFSDNYYDADLATTPSQPNTLYVAEDGLSPGAVYRLDVSSGSPVLAAANTFTNQENIEQLAVSPAGDRVIPASGYPYELDELSAGTLAPDGVIYPGQPYPSAVAVSPGNRGLVAMGLDNGYSTPDISVFPIGTPKPIFTASTNRADGSANVVPHGLALAADGSRLFAVTADDVYSTSFHLWVFLTGASASKTNTSLTVAPSPSGLGQSVTLTATVQPTDAGGSVSFYANGTAIAGCSARPLARGTASDNAVATCTTTALPLGADQVRADYSGDAGYLASSGSATTVVDKGATTTTATPAQLVKNKSGFYVATLRASLAAYGAPVAGRTIDFSSGGAQLCSAPTDSSGVASCTISVKSTATVRSLTKNGYVATFAGDGSYLASSGPATITS